MRSTVVAIFAMLCLTIINIGASMASDVIGPPKGTTTARLNPAISTPRLHLVGDSTMSDKIALAYPERGWGQLLPQFMSQQLQIVNHAANGRSTLRFANEGRWQLLLSELHHGDYVLLQFGHNDQKVTDPSRYAAADSTYQTYLTRFIEEAQSKGAIPMLATPICRRDFNEHGELRDNLKEYADAAKMVAKKHQIALFDLHQQSCDDLRRFGQQASQAYFIQVPAGLYQQFPDGKTDNTHLNVVGASWIAQLFVRELKRQQHPLASYIWREML
jgi:lysophospholipase L1-like esterase